MKVPVIEITRRGPKDASVLDADIVRPWTCGKMLIGAFDEADFRAIVSFLKKEKPELLREILCDDCSEVC